MQIFQLWQDFSIGSMTACLSLLVVNIGFWDFNFSHTRRVATISFSSHTHLLCCKVTNSMDCKTAMTFGFATLSSTPKRVTILVKCIFGILPHMYHFFPFVGFLCRLLMWQDISRLPLSYRNLALVTLEVIQTNPQLEVA